MNLLTHWTRCGRQFSIYGSGGQHEQCKPCGGLTADQRDLAACRALLAALVAEERTAYSGGVRATAAMDGAIQWLVAHPAPEGSDAE